MSDKQRADPILGIALWFVAANGVHWLITAAAHPDASTFRYIWAWAEVVVCGLAGWRLIRQARKSGGPT